jgi:hypothetical protein
MSTRDEGEHRQSMAEEARRTEAWARTWDSTYRRLASGWSKINLSLILASTTLAAGAATTGLANFLGALGTGLLALAAAIAAGLASSIGASTKATEYSTSAASNSGLADEARVFLTTVVFDSAIQDVIAKFEALCARRDAVVNSAPISRKPWPLTQAQLEAWPEGAPHAH